jgi:diguanylate cyclase (GGDEF)-like protein
MLGVRSDAMKRLVLKWGARNTVILITVFSVLISMAVTLILVVTLNHLRVASLSIMTQILVAIIVPLFAAPIISWPFVGVLFQINQLEAEMRVLATYDSLTKLLNRRVFLERAEYAHNIAKREKQDFSILAVDLDFFKRVNDQYGHTAGDNVLATFGQLVRNISRESDIAGRVGGEEFTFFLPNTTSSEAEFFADRIHAAVKETTVNHLGTSIRFTVSIGLASFTGNNSSSLDALLQFADSALYEAKKNGRNQTIKLIGL